VLEQLTTILGNRAAAWLRSFPRGRPIIWGV